MCRYHRLWGFCAVPALGVVLLSLAGCSSPTGVPSGESGSRSRASQSGASQSGDNQSSANQSSGNQSSGNQPSGNQSVQQGPPFPDQGSVSIESAAHRRQLPSDESVAQEQTQGLPAGTLLTVRLKDSVPTAAANGSFEALVDEPAMVQGEARIPRGTLVEGRIESVRTSDITPDRGVVQLTLESLRLEGIDIPIKTASLFGRQTTMRQASTSAVLLEKGRRLTFRLTVPVSLPAQPTRAGR
jgi:hypothetical protein